MPARLTVHFSSRPARSLLLPDNRRTVVGRDPECDVVLDDDRISRRHAALSGTLVGNGGGWSVADLGSKNGTQLDGVPLAEQAPGRLADRSWISFGGLVARFEVVRGEARVEKVEEERLRRFTTSLGVQRGLASGMGMAALLPSVVESMVELTGAERGFLLLAGADGELDVAARAGLSWEDFGTDGSGGFGGFGGSVGAVRRVLDSGMPVVSADAGSDAELGARASVVNTGIRALICVPVQALERMIGVMYADSRKPGAAFTDLDLEILEGLASQAGLAIAVARLDAELKGLAHRIAEDPHADPGLRAHLERSLQAARPAANHPERWAAALAAPLESGP
jgi:hypothetical protein